MQQKKGVGSSYFSFLQSVWACAACQTTALQTLSKGQLVAAIVLQSLCLVSEPDESSFLLLVSVACVYVFCFFHKKFLRPDRVSSIFEPICMGLVLVMPLASMLAALISPAFVCSIFFYPLVFWLFDNRYMPKPKEFESDSIASQSVLPATSVFSDADLRSLRDAPLDLVVGAVIGHFKDQPIYEWIQTKEGAYFHFQQALPSAAAFELLKSDCLIMAPGLLYERRAVTFIPSTTP